MEKRIVCINWGTKYGAPYINRLWAMIARNVTPPFSLTCYTDSAAGVRGEVRCLPLPPLEAVLRPGTPGIWPKARLWSETLEGLAGPVLFMDLDLVVTGDLDGFFDHGEPDDVILARNWNTPFERLGQTSIFRFPVGKLAPLKAAFLADPQGIADAYRFEQRFVTRNAPGGVTFWPYSWVQNYRAQCLWPFPLNYVLDPRLPRGCKVVIFPGGLNPPDAIAGRRTGRDAVLPAGRHIARAFAKDRERGFLRHLRSFTRPSRWVAEHWRE
ncbi:hypothetical protein BH23PSE1_BH23PSE1_17030 [soil metagenome]